MSDPISAPSPPASLTRACWRGGDGQRVTSYPLPRATAEALARAYAEFFPRQSYWLESVEWLEAAAPAKRSEGQ